MKRIFVIICAFVCAINVLSAELSLKDIETIFASSNFSSADVLLSNKDYYFIESETIGISGLKEFTWALGYASHSNNAEAWLSLTFEKYGNGPTNSLFFQVADIKTYSNILSQLNAYGYKFIETYSMPQGTISEQISVYSNDKYVLTAIISKSEDNPVRIIELVKKGSDSDRYNGKNVLKYDNGNINISYIITDGVLSGAYIHKWEDGSTYILISPRDDKWYYEIYNLSGVCLFKGTSSRTKIIMHQENRIAGYGLIKEIKDGEWREQKRDVTITIKTAVITNDVRQLYVRVE